MKLLLLCIIVLVIKQGLGNLLTNGVFVPMLRWVYQVQHNYHIYFRRMCVCYLLGVGVNGV